MFSWPTQPQRFQGEFERLYQRYVLAVVAKGGVPASREVVLAEAVKGFDSVPLVLLKLERSQA